MAQTQSVKTFESASFFYIIHNKLSLNVLDLKLPQIATVIVLNDRSTHLSFELIFLPINHINYLSYSTVIYLHAINIF